LLVEYKKLGRGNKIVDHRIGENDPTMSFDEKMAKRFALERQVQIVVIINIFRIIGLLRLIRLFSVTGNFH